MSTKLFLVFCAQAFFVQTSLSQCIRQSLVAADPGYLGVDIYGLDGPYAAPILETPYRFIDLINPAPCGLASPWTTLEYSPTSGGPLSVSSRSPLPSTGISVLSDNTFEGPLAVVGELPFVGTVAIDGELPSVGDGLINYACGNGVNAMVSEISAFGPGNAGAYAPGYAGAYGPGYAPGYAGNYAGAYAPGFASPGYAPTLGYRGECANKGCGCAW